MNTKIIRLTHVVHSFGTGGMEKGIATLVNKGSKHFEHSLLCLTTSGESRRLLKKPIRIVELKKAEGNSLRFIKRTAKALRSLNPDIIHTRNWSGLDGVIAARLAGFSNVVHGEHGWGVADVNGLKLKRLLIRRLLACWVTEFTCVSRQMLHWLHEDIRISERRITQIYNGVDCGSFRPATDLEREKIRENIGVSKNRPIIGIVSRLDPIKDHQTLFRAFYEVRKSHSQAVLLVVGDGPERRRLENIADCGIVFLGNRSDIPDVLRALDVFVLTSLNEGISNTILEAMATALPVVATNVGGTPEIAKNGATCILARPGDVDFICNAINEYLGDSEIRRAHGMAGRERVLRKFSIQAMVRGYESVWHRVAFRF